MAGRDLRHAIDTISPNPDEHPGQEKRFDSIIRFLKTLPDSKPAGWDILAETMADYKLKWDEWYALTDDHWDVLEKYEQWKGRGSFSYRYLNQTVSELCEAIGAVRDRVKEIADASVSTQTGSEGVLKGTVLEDVVKMIPAVTCRLLECGRFTHLIKGEVKTNQELKELERSIEVAIVEALHGNLYEEVLRKSPTLKDDPKAWERYLQTLRPQPIGQAVKAAEKDKAAPRYKPQPDPEESRGTSTNRSQQPGSTSAFLGGQAAV